MLHERKNTINPWEVEGNPWRTEAKFVTWVRGVLRKGWSKYPLKINYKNSRRYKVKNTNPRSQKRFPTVWMIDCEICRESFKPEFVEVDHIGAQGSFKCLSDIESYAMHLFMLTPDDMRCICKDCHKIVSLSQSHSLTFEEAIKAKETIAFLKLPIQKQMAFLASLGYNKQQCSNREKRKELFERNNKEK